MNESSGKRVIKQKTVVAQVMEQIRELIASGEYNVGDKIPTESELAEMFGLGRSSIREALKVFNYLGILESKAALGTFVSDRTNISSEALSWAILLGKNELYEMVEIRGALETWTLLKISREAAADPAIVQQLADDLEKVLDDFREAIRRNSIEELIMADYEFHRVLIKYCGNSLFTTIYDLLRDFMFEEIKATYVIFDSYEFAIEEHMTIIKSIRSGDAARMQNSLKKHIGDITDRVKTYRAGQEAGDLSDKESV
ncbi:MAG: FCD domain-containing protein [Spirochaetales bacterium]|uniref:FCD domain-containing protein n=1 Tax=Candidatus Thalassospirochaeta sargassi TaxID=3119039 RepID=A0AAJ1IDZ8_9SPIO|nr:FCD domain-containing protein [Spirochaetales bacterium]